MSLGALLLGAAGGYANSYAAKQQSEYKDAKMKALQKGEPMPEPPKSLGSQLADKVKDALPTLGYDSSKAEYGKSKKPDAATTMQSVITKPIVKSEEYEQAWNDEDSVSSEPKTFKNVYDKGAV
jgi:hypothetical protein